MKKYSKEFYNVLALLCLLQALYPPVPFDFYRQRTKWKHAAQINYHYGFGSVGTYLLVDDDLWSVFSDSGEKEPFGSFWPEFNWRKTNHLPILKQWANETTSQVYIYTDVEPHLGSPVVVRRNLAENSTFLNSNHRVNDLSLEDIDLIDCLWRQDIDAEKGLFSSIQPPERQYETDIISLNEKSFLSQANGLHISVVNDADDKWTSDEGNLSAAEYKYLKETLTSAGNGLLISGSTSTTAAKDFKDPLVSTAATAAADLASTSLNDSLLENEILSWASPSSCGFNLDDILSDNNDHLLLDEDSARLDFNLQTNETEHEIRELRPFDENDCPDSIDLFPPLGNFNEEDASKIQAFWNDSTPIFPRGQPSSSLHADNSSPNLATPVVDNFPVPFQSSSCLWQNSDSRTISESSSANSATTTTTGSALDCENWDLNSISTNDLRFTDGELVQLFGNSQFMSDLVESCRSPKNVLASVVPSSDRFSTGDSNWYSSPVSPSTSHSSSRSLNSTSDQNHIDDSARTIPPPQCFVSSPVDYPDQKPCTSSGASAYCTTTTNSFRKPCNSRNNISSAVASSLIDGFTNNIVHDHCYHLRGANNEQLPLECGHDAFTAFSIKEEPCDLSDDGGSEELSQHQSEHSTVNRPTVDEIKPPHLGAEVTADYLTEYHFSFYGQRHHLQQQPYFVPSQRDEDLLRRHRITLSAWDVNNMSGEKLQRMLTSGEYSPNQIEAIRLVRRRGRNKVAAQGCRRRRCEAVRRSQLEVDLLQEELDALVERKETLTQEKDIELDKLRHLLKQDGVP